jgi:hypothetical protein
MLSRYSSLPFFQFSMYNIFTFSESRLRQHCRRVSNNSTTREPIWRKLLQNLSHALSIAVFAVLTTTFSIDSAYRFFHDGRQNQLGPAGRLEIFEAIFI